MNFPRTIYAIQHKKTGRIYVGSSQDAKQRCISHISALRRGVHPVRLMQDDYDKHGEDYEYFILDDMADWGDRIKEYEWMKKLKTYDPSCGYNAQDPHFKNKTKWEFRFIKGVPVSNDVDD